MTDCKISWSTLVDRWQQSAPKRFIVVRLFIFKSSTKRWASVRYLMRGVKVESYHKYRTIITRSEHSPKNIGQFSSFQSLCMDYMSRRPNSIDLLFLWSSSPLVIISQEKSGKESIKHCKMFAWYKNNIIFSKNLHVYAIFWLLFPLFWSHLTL